MYVQVLHTYIHTRSPRLGKQSRHLKNCEIILYLLPLSVHSPTALSVFMFMSASMSFCVSAHNCTFVLNKRKID